MQSQLVTMIRSLRDFISEQNKDVLENAIHTLKEELDFDADAINHLHFSLYLIQDAVSISIFCVKMIVLSPYKHVS